MTRAHQTLVFQLVLASITTGLDNCITVSSIKDYSLIGHTYKTSSGKSLLSCIISCDQDVHCYSINYKLPTKTCELSDATRYSHPEELVFSQDTIHFDHPSRPSGSCVGDWPCENAGKCINLPRDPGFKCECQNDFVGDSCGGNEVTVVRMNKLKGSTIVLVLGFVLLSQQELTFRGARQKTGLMFLILAVLIDVITTRVFNCPGHRWLAKAQLLVLSFER